MWRRSPPSWLPDRRQEAAAREGTRTMIEIKHFDRLGRFDNDWLSARYHFSFANYTDPRRMGVGRLRVWNDDPIRPGRGFDPQGHITQRHTQNEQEHGRGRRWQ